MTKKIVRARNKELTLVYSYNDLTVQFKMASPNSVVS